MSESIHYKITLEITLLLQRKVLLALTKHHRTHVGLAVGSQLPWKGRRIVMGLKSLCRRREPGDGRPDGLQGNMCTYLSLCLGEIIDINIGEKGQ